MDIKNLSAQHKDSPLKSCLADGIEVVFYTDPLCCWSWALEPQWRKLQYIFRNSMTVSYKMAGLLPCWSYFRDGLNSISRPSQMGPEWMHARHVSGMPITDQIWINDPPSSSFPACIAVKCVEKQSPALGALYLRLLREAVMIHNLNIARTEILLTLASGLAAANPSFNLFQFREDLLGDAGKDAFQKDWQESKYLGVTRLPTLLFKFNGRTGAVLSGYQSFETLKNALFNTAPQLEPQADMQKDGEKYSEFWGNTLTLREKEELTDT